MGRTLSPPQAIRRGLNLTALGISLFPRPRPSEAEENNIVYGRLYRCAERWQERPVVVLLDGGFAIGYYTAFPLLARRFNRAGFNVAALVAPFNLQRRPRRPVEENCLEYAREIAQNIAEIRALTGWLLDEGCPSVGLLGFSQGGWLAGLTACSDARIACAVLTVPRVRVKSSQQIVWRRLKEALQALRPAQEAMDMTRLNLILSTPVIPIENILLKESMSCSGRGNGWRTYGKGGNNLKSGGCLTVTLARCSRRA